MALIWRHCNDAADDMFKYIFFNENYYSLIQLSPKFILIGIDAGNALVPTKWQSFHESMPNQLTNARILFHSSVASLLTTE